MSQSSPLLAMPYIQPSQAQKHVTHNEAVRTLDGIVQLSVETLNTIMPPAVPQVGGRYILGAGASGAWAGQAGKVAIWQFEGTWLFLPPKAGWTAFVRGAQIWAAFDGTVWAPVLAQAPDQVEQLGIGTSADVANRFAVASDGTLLTHAGGGHQLKLNKNTQTDTASLLFQNNYSGRAEMGLAGEDAFSVKVSADGSAWNTAISTDPATGRVAFPSGGVRAAMNTNRVYYVDPVLGSDAGAGTSTGAGAFATLAHAIDVVFKTDGFGFDVTIQLADGTHVLSAPIAIDHPLPGAREIIIQGNILDKTAVTISGAGNLFELESCRMRVAHCKMTSSGPESFLLVAHHGAQIVVDTVVFGASGWGHLDLEDGSIYVHGPCQIIGDTRFHARLELSARLSINQADYTLTGTPAFTGMFLKCGEASMTRLRSTTFTGAATGQRYFVYENAMISTGNSGETYLPGNAAGASSQGGRYR